MLLDLTGTVLHVGTPRWTRKNEHERASVTPAPIGHYVGDNPPVVVLREHHLLAASASDVDAMHPHVTSDDHVAQIPIGFLADDRQLPGHDPHELRSAV